jgi:mono/diheme cytochrome c family protein
MRLTKWLLIAAFPLLSIDIGTSWAQGGAPEMVPPGKVTTGKMEYRRSCAACHGPEAALPAAMHKGRFVAPGYNGVVTPITP